MGFRERLEDAIREWPAGGKRAFARAMQEKGIRGSSYRTLVNYLGEATEPSPTWLHAAAEELGVRLAWLSDGDGQMVTGDRETPPAEEGALDPWEFFERVAGPELTAKAHHVIVSNWWNAVVLVLKASPDVHIPDPDDIEAVGAWVLQEALYVANRVRGGDIPASRRDFNLYYSLIFQAIATAAPLPGEGGPRAELLRRLGKKGETDGTP